MVNFSSGSLMELVFGADLVVKGVLGGLVLVSVWSWALIFDRGVKFWLLKVRSDRFEGEFENLMIEELYKETKKRDNHPLARVFLACMQEWKISKIKEIIKEGGDRKESLKERLLMVMKVASNKGVVKLNRGVGFLAIIGSVAPFVGLFGTVWGILNSFQGIAVHKNATLAVVAPGIAEALLATAVGLFAAIPAVFFYNVFTNHINEFSDKLDSFSLQLLSVLSRELDR